MSDSLMINEIAPRPHNSGHYTIEACQMSQYEAHIRAILDLPLPTLSTEMLCPAIMLNILGTDTSSSYLNTCHKALTIAGAHVHLYGKGESRKGRKMGHVTFTAPTMRECEAALELCTGDKTHSLSSPVGPEVAVIMGSDSDLPVMSVGCKILEQFGVVPEVTIVSAHRTPERMVAFAKTAAARGIKVIIAGAGGALSQEFLVILTFGRCSASSWDGSGDDSTSCYWGSCKSDTFGWNGFSSIYSADARMSMFEMC